MSRVQRHEDHSLTIDGHPLTQWSPNMSTEEKLKYAEETELLAADMEERETLQADFTALLRSQTRFR